MNEIQSINIFLRVAELSSFTQAAKQLGLPNASVSTSVRELEEMLGTRLLHRTTRKVQLTPDGTVFYERGKHVLADVDELRVMFRDKSEGLKGRSEEHTSELQSLMRISYAVIGLKKTKDT